MIGDWDFNSSIEQMVLRGWQEKTWCILHIGGKCVLFVLIRLSVSEKGWSFKGSRERIWPFQLQSQSFSMMMLYKHWCSSKKRRRTRHQVIPEPLLKMKDEFTLEIWPSLSSHHCQTCNCSCRKWQKIRSNYMTDKSFFGLQWWGFKISIH